MEEKKQNEKGVECLLDVCNEYPLKKYTIRVIKAERIFVYIFFLSFFFSLLFISFEQVSFTENQDQIAPFYAYTMWFSKKLTNSRQEEKFSARASALIDRLNKPLPPIIGGQKCINV